MRRIVALVLVAVFVALPVSAGQEPGKPIEWEKVQRLKGGTQIFLTVTGSPPTKVRFLFADDTMLLTLNPARANLPSQVERTLVGIGAQWPAVLYGGLTLREARVSVSQGGVFDGTQKVGELAELTQQTPRTEVQGISESRNHRVLVTYIVVIGVAVAVAIVIGIATAICRNEGTC